MGGLSTDKKEAKKRREEEKDRVRLEKTNQKKLLNKRILEERESVTVEEPIKNLIANFITDECVDDDQPEYLFHGFPTLLQKFKSDYHNMICPKLVIESYITCIYSNEDLRDSESDIDRASVSETDTENELCSILCEPNIEMDEEYIRFRLKASLKKGFQEFLLRLPRFYYPEVRSESHIYTYTYIHGS